MDPESSKGFDDLRGIDFDWIGSDCCGFVALFSTAGGGYAPRAVLRSTDAHGVAVDAVLGLPAAFDVKFAPDLPPSAQNTWRLVAERGLFAYDSDFRGGPYRLVAAPVAPVGHGSLPPDVARVAAEVRCPLSFDALRSISKDDLIAWELLNGTA